VAQVAGIDLEKAKALPPLEGKPAPGEGLKGATYTNGSAEGEEPSTSEEVTGAK
jgi:catalase